MSFYFVFFSGRRGSVLHLLGTIPHPAADVHLPQTPVLDTSCQVATQHPVLHLRGAVLCQLSHQPDTLQHHVTQVQTGLSQHDLSTMQATAQETVAADIQILCKPA